MSRCTVITSLCSGKRKTQAGSVFLISALRKMGYDFSVIDPAGTFDFYAPPRELYCSCESPQWMNPDSIHHGDWIDQYLPDTTAPEELILFSAQFSPDIIFHARNSYNLKNSDPSITTVIGGAALTGLKNDQLELIAQFFDYVLVGYDVESLLSQALTDCSSLRHGGAIIKAMSPPNFTPDYSLVQLHDFVTVYTGHGCYHGGCRFCDFPSRVENIVNFRNPADVAEDIRIITEINPSVKDIFLTQDSYSCQYLKNTLKEIKRKCLKAPISLMLRGEPWVTEEIGEQLADVGCTDVFIGAEGFDDEILLLLNKGLSTRNIINSIKALSNFVNVTIGMILFIPNIAKNSLETQLRKLESALPFIHGIEPEILTVVNGSEFEKNASQYGILLNATENVLNDSWCFGLSQDVPWTMRNPDQINIWFEHVSKLKELCCEKVDSGYWDNIELLKSDLGLLVG